MVKANPRMRVFPYAPGLIFETKHLKVSCFDHQTSLVHESFPKNVIEYGSSMGRGGSRTKPRMRDFIYETKYACVT